MKNNILDYFPMDTPRKTQVEVLKRIEAGFEAGVRYIIVEAPVGSGKSPIAITAARRYGASHLLTPRKNLQDQYFEDFHQHISLMKGRGAYPCVYSDASQYSNIVSEISRGGTPSPSITGVSVAEGPCSSGNKKIYEECCARHECPYSVAINVAMGENHVVHNVHGFIFQAYMHGRFAKRGLVVVDECHNLEDICREFSSREIRVRGLAGEDFTIPDFRFVDDYQEFFMQDKFMPRRKEDRESYILTVESLMKSGMRDFVVDYKNDDFFRKTDIKFIPKSVAHVPESLIFQFGERILLMSGTIYDKDDFCRSLGISTEESLFIRISSTFPPARRPIVMKPEYMVDTSHAKWNDNIGKIVEIIQTIMDKFPDVKGLVHTPSYSANNQILKLLKSDRVMTHTSLDFRDALEEFYSEKAPRVFLSPVCQEGVDFKGDRARFQIILRVPYPNAGDKFTRVKMEESFQWYNYKALKTFGQQVGRINRSEDDHGVTVLVDSRFPRFISNNRRKLPQWMLDAIKDK